eukprot:scaffold2598_cov190-Pinguiococcus_pyrenoidosus.AAC.1
MLLAEAKRSVVCNDSPWCNSRYSSTPPPSLPGSWAGLASCRLLVTQTAHPARHLPARKRTTMSPDFFTRQAARVGRLRRFGSAFARRGVSSTLVRPALFARSAPLPERPSPAAHVPEIPRRHRRARARRRRRAAEA